MPSHSEIIPQIERMLGTPGQPYRVWSETTGAVADGGWRWVAQPQIPTADQVDRLNAIVQRAFAAAAQQVTTESFDEVVLQHYSAESDQLDEFTRQWGYDYLTRPEQLGKAEREHERLFRRVRRLAAQVGLSAYKTELDWNNKLIAGYLAIVVAPLADQFDILRTEATQGNNHPRTTETIIRALQPIHAAYGICLTGAHATMLEFWFKRMPRDAEARRVSKQIVKLAPDMSELTDELPRCVVLGWD